MEFNKEKEPLLPQLVPIGPGRERATNNYNHPLHKRKSLLQNPEYDPFSNRSYVQHPTSNADTAIHLLKGNIGTGILAMPDAFKNAGFTFGIFGTIFIGFLAIYSMNLLVKCSHELSRRRKMPQLNFSEVVEAAFNEGPEVFRQYAYFAARSVNLFLCLAQLGFCCVYFVFVASNLKVIVFSWFKIDISLGYYMLFILLPMIVFNWITNLQVLAKFELFANFLMGIALGIVFYYCFQDFQDLSVRRHHFWLSKKPESLALYFGTAIYTFEGIGFVLPLENKMKRPQDFGGLNGVLTKTMFFVGALYLAVGFSGYLTYGEKVEGSITLNLPCGDLLPDIARLMVAISIFLTYALPFYVPIEIMMTNLKWNLRERYWTLAELVLRTVMVVITFLVAELMPDLDALISLVGAFCSATLAFIIPSIISIFTNWTYLQGGCCRCLFLKDLFILAFGLIGLVAGTYVSFQEIIKESYQNDLNEIESLIFNQTQTNI